MPQPFSPAACGSHSLCQPALEEAGHLQASVLSAPCPLSLHYSQPAWSELQESVLRALCTMFHSRLQSLLLSPRLLCGDHSLGRPEHLSYRLLHGGNPLMCCVGCFAASFCSYSTPMCAPYQGATRAPKMVLPLVCLLMRHILQVNF